MKFGTSILALLMLVVGCSRYESVPIVIGEGVVVCWGHPSWVRNDYPHPVKVQCHGYHCNFSLLGSATHDYPIKWIVTLQPGQRKLVTIDSINDSFRVYKGSELLDKLKTTWIFLDKEVVMERDVRTEKALCDYVGGLAGEIRETCAPGDSYWPPISK